MASYVNVIVNQTAPSKTWQKYRPELHVFVHQPFLQTGVAGIPSQALKKEGSRIRKTVVPSLSGIAGFEERLQQWQLPHPD
jgi:hypothetical protein